MHLERDPETTSQRPRWAGASARLELAALFAWLLAGWITLSWTRPAPPEGSLAPPEDCGGRCPRLVVLRATERGAEWIRDGTEADEGDLLQIAYREGGGRYGAIVSVDGWGVVTRHLPEEGDEAVPLADAGLVQLDHAFRLDNAPSFERFLLLTSQRPFSLSPVERALASGTGLPGALTQDTLEVEKPDRAQP